MSDARNPHDTPPDPWVNPTWEDPDFIAGNFNKANVPGTFSISPPETAAMAAAEATLGEFRGALAAIPRPLATGAIKRLCFKEAAAYLHTVAEWIHPADLALRDIGATSGILAAIRNGKPRAALPATFSSTHEYMRPIDESEDWARTLDHHAETGILLARTLSRMALSTLGQTDTRYPLERLDLAGTPDSDRDPLRFRKLWPGFHATLKPEDHQKRDIWSTHLIGQRWRSVERSLGDGDGNAVARLALCLAAWFRRDRPGPWLLPWLSRLPRRYRSTKAVFTLFVDSPTRRIAWLEAVRKAALEGLATISALRQAMELAETSRDMRDTALRKKVIELALSDAVITTGSATRACRAHHASVLAVLVRLETIGVLKEITGRDRYRVWCCGL